jgi:hypothetical protein
MRKLLFMALMVLGSAAFAGDAYHEYIADFHLNESHQARQQSPVIRYADGEKGALLRSVLSPGRLSAALKLWGEASLRGEQVPELPKLLPPLLARYQVAFEGDPRAFETEYLDSVEAGLEVMTASMARNRPTSMPVPQNTPPAQLTKENQALVNSMQALLTVSQKLLARIFEAAAEDLRDKVRKGLFTEQGAQRALALAERWTAPR